MFTDPYEGDTVTLKLNLKNKAGPLTNAAEVSATVTTPDGTTIGPLTLTAGQVTNAGDGEYRVNVDLEEAGPYVVVWRARSPANEKKGTVDRFDATRLTA